MKKAIIVAFLALVALAVWSVARWESERRATEQLHSDRDETEVLVSYPREVASELMKAGRSLDEATAVRFSGNEIWLPPGNYFLETTFGMQTAFYPIPLKGFRCGLDEDGSFVVTVRGPADTQPPRLIETLGDFAPIPGGTFLLGDRLNLRESHYVWLTGYFIGRFEVTNDEFREFLNAADGYSNDANWTEAGRRWKSVNKSNTTAVLSERHPNYKRFGRGDQAVTWINWFEANAYCTWLTNTLGRKKWFFSLPSEAEWEKAARGPDNFDYGLGMAIGDVESSLYNWKKNPDATVTVVGIRETILGFRSNRYGLFHVSGNVTEWTQSVNRQYNQLQPYRDDERNHDDTDGLRVVRGGSWYSASTAYLYIPYRDAYQPEHSTQEIGFRVVARMLP